MEFKEQNAALILIDFQKGFDGGEYLTRHRNNKDAEQSASVILNKWRALNLPVIHVIHSSKNPQSRFHKSHPGYEIKEEVKPIEGELVIEKRVHSAFIGTDLKERLDSKCIKMLVIAGMTTNQCISSSTRMASDLGFDTFLISDATAAFDMVGLNGEKFSAETIHLTTLTTLHNGFTQVINTKELIELLN